MIFGSDSPSLKISNVISHCAVYDHTAVTAAYLITNYHPLASLQSLCPSSHRGSHCQPTHRTPPVPPATLSPSPLSPLEKQIHQK